MTYEQHAKENGLTDQQIEANMGDLKNEEMIFVEETDTHREYKIAGYSLFANNSACDTIEDVASGEMNFLDN